MTVQTGSPIQYAPASAPQQDAAAMFAQLFVLGFIAWMFWEVFVKESKPAAPKFGKEF